MVAASPFEFISPSDGSRFHKCETQIVFRPANGIDLSDRALMRSTTLSGSMSGMIPFNLKVLERIRTYVLIPERAFLPGEQISVEFNGSLKHTLTFHIESVASRDLQPLRWTEADEFLGLTTSRNPPPDFPEAFVTQNGETASGYIYGTTVANMYDLFVLDNTGSPVFKRNVDLVTAQNFRYINDSLCVYASLTDQFYVGLNADFEITDTFQCVNGYSTDFHEFVMTDEGHVILGSFDQQVIDMSQIVAGGDPNAVVTGLVLQEIDDAGNLIFQWRSWDHFEITDAIYNGGDTVDFTDDNISYVHFNSLEIDLDGNWIISSRHLSEVTKISRTTGEVLWRMGGKNNQFTFIGDTLSGFNLQHDARVTTGGNLTIFDNGVFHDPPQTRVIEYDIDQQEMTATLIWEFPNPYGDVTLVAGNAQRLANGNTFINWGRRTTMPSPQDFFLEVDSAGNHVFEMSFVVPGQMGWIYRAYRLPFKGDSTTSAGPAIRELEARVHIYPNPSRSEIRIEFEPQKPGVYEWMIYSAAGVKVLDGVFPIAENPGAHPVSLDGLPPGNYFIQFNNDAGDKMVRSFVKLN